MFQWRSLSFQVFNFLCGKLWTSPHLRQNMQELRVPVLLSPQIIQVEQIRNPRTHKNSKDDECMALLFSTLKLQPELQQRPNDESFVSPLRSLPRLHSRSSSSCHLCPCKHGFHPRLPVRSLRIPKVVAAGRGRRDCTWLILAEYSPCTAVWRLAPPEFVWTSDEWAF